MTDSSATSPIDPLVRFRTICRRNGLNLSDDQLGLFRRFAESLLAWNQKVNLISRKDERQVWDAHLLHSVSILMRIPPPRGARVLDLGTGGGLPGIPLKICRPDISVTLLDATKKKIDAVADMIVQLGLQEIDTCWGRAEEVGRQAAYAHQYDVVTARAVAPLKDLIKWAKPFLRTPLRGTQLITLKGGDLETEIRHARSSSEVKEIRTIALDLADASEFLASDKKIVVVAF
jgi:16S rRNA (guanine527-N7)-methyltransferase